MLEYVTGAPLGWRLALLPPELRFLSGIPPEVAPIGDALLDVAYPVLGRSFVAPPPVCNDDSCEVGTDAVMFGIKLQPVMAVSDGVVTAVDEGNPVSGEVSVTIADPPGAPTATPGSTTTTPAPTTAPRRVTCGSPRSPASAPPCAPARSSASWATPTRCPPTRTAASSPVTRSGRTYG